MMSLRLRRTLLGVVVAVFAVCAAGVLAPAARADGDPGSDVLVYQNLFVATDANVSIPQQVELGDLLTSAANAGFPIRVALISQPDDLGAITALWQKPAAYASFLGTELSLTYAQRLLIVMPNGFGFNWQGHSSTAAYKVLDGLHIGSGGSSLVTAAEIGVRALAQASRVRLAAPASAASGSAARRHGTRDHGTGDSGRRTPRTDQRTVRQPGSDHRRDRTRGPDRDRSGLLARISRRGPAAEAAAATAEAATPPHSRYLARGRVRGRGGLADRRARGDPAIG